MALLERISLVAVQMYYAQLSQEMRKQKARMVALILPTMLLLNWDASVRLLVPTFVYLVGTKCVLLEIGLDQYLIAFLTESEILCS